MTSEHCGHECVCMGYCNRNCMIDNSPCTKEKCEHDTRTHSAAPERDERNTRAKIMDTSTLPVFPGELEISEPIWKCAICGAITTKSHEHKYQEVLEQAKRDERERVRAFHSTLKKESEIELIEEQRDFTEGLKEALEILYEIYPELRGEQR